MTGLPFTEFGRTPVLLLSNSEHVFTAERVFVAAGFSPAAVHGPPLRWLLLLPSTDSGRMGLRSWAPGLQGTGAAAVVHGLSCSAACGIFPDEGPNPCLLH